MIDVSYFYIAFSIVIVWLVYLHCSMVKFKNNIYSRIYKIKDLLVIYRHKINHEEYGKFQATGGQRRHLFSIGPMSTTITEFDVRDIVLMILEYLQLDYEETEPKPAEAKLVKKRKVQGK